VEFPGFVREPFGLMAASALFVLSSRYEGFPLVLIEAMAAGLPVVSTDCPTGPADVVHDGVDGFLVPVGDVDALAKRMSELMDDPSLREAMGRRAQAAVERFRPEVIWEKWDDVIRSVVA
jgi:glycosyltransferase involved in cell wall biosynthesis